MGLTPRAREVNTRGKTLRSHFVPGISTITNCVQKETWEDSDSRFDDSEYMLFVPVVGAARVDPPVATASLEAPRSTGDPSANSSKRLRREWSRFRDLIRGGHASKPYPREAEDVASSTFAQTARTRPTLRTRSRRQLENHECQEELLAEQGVRCPDRRSGPSLSTRTSPNCARPPQPTNDEGVAHHESSFRVGHAGVGPVVREAVEAFELDRGESPVATVTVSDDVLEARGGRAAFAGEDRPRWVGRSGRGMR